jgi:hypothetical protein
LLYPIELLAHMVLAVGLEPTRYLYQRILSPSRLPIPPRQHILIAERLVWLIS